MSDEFTIVVDDRKARLKLEAMPDQVKEALYGKTRELEQSLLSVVKARASGGLVGVRTGEYLRSIRGTTRLGKASVTATIRSKSPIAHIIESGADIPAHDILPKVGKALKFTGGAGQVFAAKVSHPAVKLPAKPVIEGAFADMKDAIVAELKQTAIDSAKESWAR